jgi:hypothetical protein
MSTTEIKETKERIIQEIQLVKDEWILKAIQKLLDIEHDINIEQYNKDIDISMEQYKAGNYKTQEQLEAESKKW